MYSDTPLLDVLSVRLVDHVTRTDGTVCSHDNNAADQRTRLSGGVDDPSDHEVAVVSLPERCVVVVHVFPPREGRAHIQRHHAGLEWVIY